MYVERLPKQFDKKEWDVRVVIPNYSLYPGEVPE